MKLEPFKTAMKLLITYFSLLNRLEILMYLATLSHCRDNTITPEFSNKGIEYLSIYIRKYIQKHKRCTISVEATAQNYHLMQVFTK